MSVGGVVSALSLVGGASIYIYIPNSTTGLPCAPYGPRWVFSPPDQVAHVWVVMVQLINRSVAVIRWGEQGFLSSG